MDPEEELQYYKLQVQILENCLENERNKSSGLQNACDVLRRDLWNALSSRAALGSSEETVVNHVSESDMNGFPYH